MRGALLGSLMALPATAFSGGGDCDFDIHYNRWIGGFEPKEYEHNGKKGGVHCLEACCRDPSCTGIEMESSLDSQCYKYDSYPKGLDGTGRPLSQFLSGEVVHEWSVFIKRPPTTPQHAGRTFTESLKKALVARPHRVQSLMSREDDLDRKLRGMAGSQIRSSCEWTTYYDTWRPSFDRGEYTQDESFGGAHAHCLELCCHDPTCTGLAMDSTELHQCYKYSHMPEALKEGGGKRLGDALWLQKKPSRWSIVVKATLPSKPLPNLAVLKPRQGSVPAGTAAPRAALADPGTMSFISWLMTGDRAAYFRWIALAVPLLALFGFLSGQGGKRDVKFELKPLVRMMDAGRESMPLLTGGIKHQPDVGAGVASAFSRH